MSVSAVEKVLESAKSLWDRQGELDHDLVDGEFYWRHCRREILGDLLEFFESSPDPLPEDSHGELSALVFELQRANPSLSSWIDRRISAPRMRDAITAWYRDEPSEVPVFASRERKKAGTGYWLHVGVTNSHWTGTDVERICNDEAKRIRQSSDEARRQWLQEAHDRSSTTTSFVGIDFTVYEPGQLFVDAMFPDPHNVRQWLVPVESPVIMCAIPYPYPPAGVIATIYDAVARQQHRWHETLYGHVAADQRTSTSIRTWAIGLLVGLGMQWRIAERDVAEALGIEGILENSQWTIDRQNLLARVPEAKPYVYAPGRTPKNSNTPNP